MPLRSMPTGGTSKANQSMQSPSGSGSRGSHSGHLLVQHRAVPQVHHGVGEDPTPNPWIDRIASMPAGIAFTRPCDIDYRAERRRRHVLCRRPGSIQHQ